MHNIATAGHPLPFLDSEGEKQRQAILIERFATAAVLLLLFLIHPCYFVLYLVSAPVVEAAIAILESA